MAMAQNSTDRASPDVQPSWRQLKANISDSSLYPFLIRLAILTYRTQPRFIRHDSTQSMATSSPSPDLSGRRLHPTVSHTRTHSRASSIHDRLSPEPSHNGTGAPVSAPSFGNLKLPKDVPKLLQAKFKDMALKPDSKIQRDPLLRRSYLAFYAVLLDPESLRKVKESRRAEDLVMMFLSCVAKELNKSAIDPVELKHNVDHHGAAFVGLLIETIREAGSAHGSHALLKQLESYELSLKSTSKLALQPTMMTNNSGTSSDNRTHNTPTYEIADMQLAKEIISLLLVARSEMQRDIDEAKAAATESLAVAELKCIERDLRDYNSHNQYQPIDFRSEAEFDEWKDRELQAISQQISHLVATRSSTLVDVPVPEHRNSLFYIPPDPKSYYRHLLKRCLERDYKAAGKELSENPDVVTVLMSKPSVELLTKVGNLWRVSLTTRAVLLLDVAEEVFKEGTLTLDNLTDAFNLAKHVATDQGKKPWSPNSWPHCDEVHFMTVLSEVQKSLLDRVGQALEHIYDDSPPKIGPILEVLDEHVLSNTDLQGFASLDPSQKQIKQLEMVVIATAEKKYDILIDDIPRDHTLDPLHIIDLADKLIAIAKRLQKRYKFALFGKISIGHISSQRHLTLFSADSKSMFTHMMTHMRARNEEPSFDDMIVLYKKVAEIRDLFVQVSDLAFGFDIETSFYPFVLKWAESSAELAQSWVDPAIENDNFLPMDEAAGQLHSSSVADMFTSFRSALNVISDLKWRNELHVARLLTILMKGISGATCQYAVKLLNLFMEELKSGEEPVAQVRSRQDKWIALAKTAVNNKVTVTPYRFLKETCVKLNNLERTQVDLDKIESELDSEKQSEIISAVERSHKKANGYLFSVRIVQAEGLKACDMNGLSDPYVTLVDQQTRKQIGKTRTIYEDLNPVWDEMFDLATSGPKWLTATVWDENSISNHDLCGRAFIRLDPGAFQDFVSQVNLQKP
jgi:hypothetical protein